MESCYLFGYFGRKPGEWSNNNTTGKRECGFFDRQDWKFVVY